MFKELWWMIKLLFNKIEYKESCVIKKMKHFPFKGFSAMSWCTYLLTRRDRVSNPTIRHENLHLKQEIANFLGKKHIRYYLSYFWEYLKGLMVLWSFNAAYYTNPYEMEAYANSDNQDYLVTKGSYKKYKIKDIRLVYKQNKRNWINYVKTI